MISARHSCKNWPGSTARRCSWSITTSCARTTRRSSGICRACRPITPSRRTPIRRSSRRFTRPARASTWPRWPSSALVHENIKPLPAKERQDFIWDKIIYANPIKDIETLDELDPYKPLVTFDNRDEIGKMQKHAPHAGLVLRMRVPNTGAVVELSSKFGAASGEAVDLIEAAFQAGLTVEGLSFHVGSQCTNFANYVQALNLAAGIFEEAHERGFPQVKILDIGGGFPAPYDQHVKPFEQLAKLLNAEFDRLFPKDMEILAEPGRFLVATAATSCRRRDRQGGARRQALLLHQRRRLSHLLRRDLRPLPLSRFKRSRTGRRRSAAVFGPTCDALDTISLAEELPDLELGDFVYSRNIGAYTHASSTHFNGFPPAQVIHLNRL